MAETARNLLVEIGTEELPPKSLRRLSEAFGSELVAELGTAQVEHGDATLYATPRRLAVMIKDVAPRQPDRQSERKGPALRAAFDADGKPTKAAIGFAKSCGVDVDQLEQVESGKESRLVFRSTDIGQPTEALLPAMVNDSLARLPIPKRMRWADHDTEFVRPVHWVVLLLGEEIVHAEVLGVESGRQTHGHRFHQPHALPIDEPAQYATLLHRTGHVVARFESRRDMIRGQAEQAAERLGGHAVIDPELLDEVTALVEWPVPVTGTFDDAFLELPASVLIASMTGHQRYFPVVDGNGKLMPHFIAISNIESRNPDAVREGNERVIRPRLSDADFFYKSDLRRPLAERLDDLASIVFQKKLGSVRNKSVRVSKLAGSIARMLGSDDATVTLAERAGLLSKCDLTTEIVGEFPELQGEAGGIYARKTGEPEPVAQAIAQAYMPRFAGDGIPESAVGRAVALADKLDSLTGIFGIGQNPSGDSDPFALRRGALGCLRILIEGDLDLDLEALLTAAARGYDGTFEPEPVVGTVFDYMLERLRAYFGDQGIAPDVYAAVLARRPTRPLDFARRMRAVDAFRKLPEATNLSAANKRIQNILRQADGSGAAEVKAGLLGEGEERALADQLDALRPEVQGLLENANYEAALARLAGLRDAIDLFFDKVKVMDDNDAVRGNRLALLSSVGELFLETADVSLLQG